MRSTIKSYAFKPGLPVEFEIINVSDILEKFKGQLIHPHRNEFYNIIWIERGNPTIWIDFKPYITKPNSLIFIPAHSVKYFELKDNFEGKMILFTDEFFHKTQSDWNFLHSTILFNDFFEHTLIDLPSGDSDFKTLLNALLKEQQSNADLLHSDILRNYLHNFMLLSERLKREQGFKEIKTSADLEHFLKFKHLIDIHFRHEKSARFYSNLLGISEKRLYNATIQVVDKSPKQLIDERIILEAKRLLAHEIKSVKEIAFELGYDEPSNFIKYFKNHTSNTPNEFKLLYRH